MLKRLLARVLDRVAASYRFNQQWREANRELLVGQHCLRPADVGYEPAPERYRCADVDDAESRVDAAGPPLFVSARFRSGSTLLWNMFRHTPGVTAYYEPLNERQWFLSRPGNDRTDRTHVNVDQYWHEYRDMPQLGQWFTEDWTYKDLYMDERSCDRRMARYLGELIRCAPGRPVLQCNRLDFRLAWVRRQFPRAGILVLYRNPREQWLSVQRSSSGAPPSHRLVPDEPEDYFYTLAWARDLRRVFPFLDPAEQDHAYAVHYLLWRLSYLFGCRYADRMLAYEDLIADPDGQLRAVLEHFDINAGALPADGYGDLLQPARPERWPDYADAAWFADIESCCEDELRQFFGAG